MTTTWRIILTITAIQKLFISVEILFLWVMVKRRMNKTFTDIRLRPGIATPLSSNGPLQPNMTSSIKPEVHNVSQRRQKRPEPLPQGIDLRTNFAKIGLAVPEICSLTDTDRHREVGERSIAISLSVCLCLSVCPRAVPGRSIDGSEASVTDFRRR